MANETRYQTATLKEKLLSSGSRYGFFQAYRLLHLINTAEGLDNKIKVRPTLSLAFPETDIEDIKQLADQSYLITANFLGLYGVSSPLPTFYTEDLLEEFRNDRHAQRDLLDLLNETIYSLLIKVWLKARPQIAFKEMHKKTYMSVFYSFIGINEPEKLKYQVGIESVLRFAAIYSIFPRSALGLQSILSGVYRTLKIEILQCTLKIVPIPEDQRCRLGVQATTLGEDCHIGNLVPDRSNNLTIEISEVSESMFRLFMPGQLEYKRLEFLVRAYLVDPLNVTLKLVLAKGAAKGAACSSGPWGQLGVDTWLSPQENLPHEVSYLI